VWFNQGAALEQEDAEAARAAYERAIAADPGFLDAHINLGRLLHDSGCLPKAEQVYREAIRGCGDDPVLLYNLGALLDDMGRKAEAVDAYESALRLDPGLADCHYNLSLLYQEQAKPKEALRHMARYRKLIGARSK
jgi:tetratricopeptide (TPR) repeat protein